MLNLIKIKTLNKKKRYATNWEQIFAIHISDKGLLSGEYKEPL